MGTGDRNTLHITKEGNDEAAEYLATKAGGETCELRVTGQIRENSDGSAVIDIISVEPMDYEAMPPLSPDDETQAEVIGGIFEQK